MSHERVDLDVPRFEQPDDLTCGPSCLYKVLRFYGDETPFERVAELTPRNPDGGTLAVYLALVARRLGYRARITSYNLRVFDPTWSELEAEALAAKLRQRAARKPKPKLKAACRAYAELLEAGGELEFDELSVELLVGILRRGHPILCGLNATHLYLQARERPDDNEADDVEGDPVGHFLVISGYAEGEFSVVDPFTHVPDATGTYRVPAQRLINSILLGIVSYDAVLLEVWPEEVS